MTVKKIRRTILIVTIRTGLRTSSRSGHRPWVRDYNYSRWQGDFAIDNQVPAPGYRGLYAAAASRREIYIKAPSTRDAMPAYCLFQNLRITNPSLMEDYVSQVKPITESFGDQYIVMGGQVDVKEGEWAPVFPVMIEFPTMDAATAWYNSSDYAPLKDLRLSAANLALYF